MNRTYLAIALAAFVQSSHASELSIATAASGNASGACAVTGDGRARVILRCTGQPEFEAQVQEAIATIAPNDAVLLDEEVFTPGYEGSTKRATDLALSHIVFTPKPSVVLAKAIQLEKQVAVLGPRAQRAESLEREVADLTHQLQAARSLQLASAAAAAAAAAPPATESLESSQGEVALAEAPVRAHDAPHPSEALMVSLADRLAKLNAQVETLMAQKEEPDPKTESGQAAALMAALEAQGMIVSSQTTDQKLAEIQAKIEALQAKESIPSASVDPVRVDALAAALEAQGKVISNHATQLHAYNTAQKAVEAKPTFVGVATGIPTTIRPTGEASSVARSTKTAITPVRYYARLAVKDAQAEGAHYVTNKQGHNVLVMGPYEAMGSIASTLAFKGIYPVGFMSSADLY